MQSTKRSKSPLSVSRVERCPSKVSSKSTEKWVVLDIDSTLVFSRPADLDKGVESDERNFYVRPVSLETVLRVTKRPYLDKFLDDLVNHGYKIIVWSAGAPSYVKSIVSVLFEGRGFEYVMTSDHLIDDTKKLNSICKVLDGFDPKQSRLVDDSKYHADGQEELFIHVDRYIVSGHHPTSQEDDNVLKTLIDVINESFK